MDWIIVYSFDHVRELRNNCDILIVLYHGGREHYRYPTPELQRVFHKFAECGADVVIAQHTHCIGCAEEYQGKTLIYGQGNFLFDNSDIEEWQTSLLVEVQYDGQVFPIRILNKLSKYRLSGRLYSGSNVLALENYVSCETHRELMIKICQLERKRETT